MALIHTCYRITDIDRLCYIVTHNGIGTTYTHTIGSRP